MLLLAQIALLVLVGSAFVLFGLWSHTTGKGSLWIVGAGAGLAYLLFVLKTLLQKDPEKLGRKLWNRHAAKPAVLAPLLLIALGANVLLLLRILEPVRIDVTLRPGTASVPGEQEEGPFRVTLEVPGEAAIEPAETRDRASFVLPTRDRESPLLVRVDHPAYTPLFRQTTVGEAEAGLVLRPAPRPRLVVELRPRTAGGGMRVSAGVVGAPPEEGERGFRSGQAVFLARMDEDWRVLVVDERRKAEHVSPFLEIDRAVRAYEVDTTDRNRWSEIPDPATPRVLPVSGITRLRGPVASIGERATAAVAERFLYGGLPDDSKVVVRERFLLSYNPKLKIPNWVAYRLDLRPDPSPRRRPVIRPDPDLEKRLLADAKDYTTSGYDRGHLVSPADMRRYGAKAVEQASQSSALAPQTPSLNQGAWLALETYARGWVKARNEWICVVAGPVFDRREKVRTIGKSGVAVPDRYFRVLIREVRGRAEALCFLVPNAPKVEPDPKAHLVSLATVEKATGLRFFRDLQEELRPDPRTVPKAVWPLR